MSSHVKLTAHARMRAQQMGVPTKEVKKIVRTYEVCYPSTPGSSEGRVILQSGDLAAIYDPATRLIHTVLPRTSEEYVRPEAV